MNGWIWGIRSKMFIRWSDSLHTQMRMLLYPKGTIDFAHNPSISFRPPCPQPSASCSTATCLLTRCNLVSRQRVGTTQIISLWNWRWRLQNLGDPARSPGNCKVQGPNLCLESNSVLCFCKRRLLLTITPQFRIHLGEPCPLGVR